MSRLHGRARARGRAPGRRRRRLADSTRSRGARSGLRTVTEDRSARTCLLARDDPLSRSMAVNESSTRVAHVAVGASSQHSYWLQFSGQTVKGSTSGRGRDQHQRPWAQKLLAPSCRQSRQAEANTMRASSRAYCWRCVAFPLSCSKRAPRPDPNPSLRRIDQTCLASCPASIRVEACGVEKELSFFRTATDGEQLLGRTRRIAAFVSIPHPKTC